MCFPEETADTKEEEDMKPTNIYYTTNKKIEQTHIEKSIFIVTP
jgi:hypothetical protein